MSTLTIKHQIKFKRHEGQTLFHLCNARFRILACGRRWGKTKIGAVEFILMMLDAPENALGYCVAPTFSHTRKQWKEILYYCPRELIIGINRADHIITLLGNREIVFKSADAPDSMRGDAVYLAWIDEYGQIAEDRWTLELRPALMDTRGKAIFTGTPKGKNWGFQLWTRGQDPKQTDYKSFSFSSYSNPYLDPKEIDEFKRDMPELAFKQEIMGEFLEDVGSVFRGVDRCVKGQTEPPQTQTEYYAGVDLAKHADYTVISILNSHGHLVGFDRFGELDWVLIRRRVINLCSQYQARILVDSSGVGDPFYDEIRREGAQVEGYKFTNASKADLIENLSICIENQTISYPDIPELINELKLFGYKKQPSGLTLYGAPEGYHDDCVISLALAAWWLKKPQSTISFLGSRR